MKNLIVILLAVFSLGTISAQQAPTELIIDAFNESGMSIKIDGKGYPLKKGQTSIRGIRPGVHNIKVYKKKRRGAHGHHGHYGSGNGRKLVAQGRLEVRKHSRIFAHVNRAHGFAVDEVVHLHPGGHNGYGQYGGYGYNNPYGSQDADSYYGNGSYYEYGTNDPYGNSYGNGSSAYGSYTDSYGGYSNPPAAGGSCGTGNNYGNGYGNTAADAAFFQDIMSDLRNQTFESTRLNIALNLLEKNRFTSREVKEMLTAFDFESSRLKLAKAAYPSVLDPERYTTVFDAFSFSSSVDSLLEHMR